MATTKLYLDLRGKAKDGKGSVLISLYHNNSTATFATGIRLLPSHWSQGKVIKRPDAVAINAQLQKQKTKIDLAIAMLSLDANFSRMTATDVKAEISDAKTKRKRSYLIRDLFDEYMNDGNMKSGTRSIYNSTLKKVIAFGGEGMKIDSVNLRWLRAFEHHLSLTQGTNGRSMYLRCLRTICNYARHNGLMTVYPFENFQIKQEETKKRNLHVSLMRSFYDCPTTELNSMYRDYFFLMFYLIGINSVDLLTATKDMVVDGRLEYIRHKTNKKYSIKIEPEAAILLEKYRGKGSYLLEALDHCQHYHHFTRQINEAIQTIGYNGNPLIPSLTTYYARHTWSTLAHEIGISTDTISQALGHSFGNRTTLIYINPDRSKVDEANRRVIDYFHSTAILSV